MNDAVQMDQPSGLVTGTAQTHYYDHRFDIQAAKVLPGEYAVGDASVLLVTTLGSCVSACLRDPEAGIGGLNHFMLPDGTDGPGALTQPAKYGAQAMDLLIHELLRRGARRERLEAKVFGGGNVLASMSVSNIGERNARFVLSYLSSENIRVAAQDLLDVHPRKLYFWPATGRVLVKKLKVAHNTTIVEREREYSTRLHVLAQQQEGRTGGYA